MDKPKLRFVPGPMPLTEQGSSGPAWEVYAADEMDAYIEHLTAQAYPIVQGASRFRQEGVSHLYDTVNHRYYVPEMKCEQDKINVAIKLVEEIRTECAALSNVKVPHTKRGALALLTSTLTARIVGLRQKFLELR